VTSVDRFAELEQLRDGIIDGFVAMNEARERGLAASRQVIRSCSRSIRMIHRNEFDEATAMAAKAEGSLREAQTALAPFPKIAHAGFLHDAEKEYAEARLTVAFVRSQPLPTANDLQVEAAAWLNGLAEAASELRRYLLDQLRKGDISRGDELLEDMDDAYELLASLDFPDAITGGLRRTTDAFRAVLERTRSDHTTTVMQEQLRAAIERHGWSGDGNEA
jgi:translin